jgi:hypothetical protein
MVREKIRHFILQERIPLPAWLYYWLLKRLSKCKTCLDGVIFPQYGVAPHTHNLIRTNGSFIGSTELIPKAKWPENYVDYDEGCGVYYCPEKECKYSKEKQHKQLYRLYNNP